MIKKHIAELIFWIHVILFTVWFSLFFVPGSIWPKRVVIHFWYITIFVLSELIMGLVLMKKMKKFRIVCPLTSLMQYLRGYDYGDPSNYDHSFVREFASRFKIKIPYGVVGFFIFLSLGVVVIQYYLYLI